MNLVTIFRTIVGVVMLKLLNQAIRGISRQGSRKGRLIDKVRIYARGGTGGQGSEKVGGVGGVGGCVKVCAVRGASLTDLARRENRRFIAGTGESSTSGRVFGIKGRDVIIKVPPGTVVTKENGSVFCDLDLAGSSAVLVRGGSGGSHVTKGYSGIKGQRATFILELKLIADVGLVGFPNAGKSTLLRLLSNAEPKIANYPFTTIRPQLGVLSCDTDRPITLADLPGLVEGAHLNAGMGHKFLRHIERTRVLLFVVDIGGFQLSDKHPRRTASETVDCLIDELEQYKEGLSRRPSMLVLNKMDSPGSDLELSQFTGGGLFQHVMPTSALYPDNCSVHELKQTLLTMAAEEY